jgi:hypothetical protein
MREVRTIQKVPVQKAKMPDGKGGFVTSIDLEDKEVVTQVPDTVKVKRQHPLTGEMEDFEVAKLEDLAPRTYLVRVSVGQEDVCRDFCKDCLEEYMPKIKSLFQALSNVKPKE